MVNYVGHILERIIPPLQIAFIPNQTIHENVLITQEVMNKFKNMKVISLELNMEEAYDKVEWNFIYKCLQGMGFHEQWIHWIHEYISLISYAIIFLQR